MTRAFIWRGAVRLFTPQADPILRTDWKHCYYRVMRSDFCLQASLTCPHYFQYKTKQAHFRLYGETGLARWMFYSTPQSCCQAFVSVEVTKYVLTEDDSIRKSTILSVYCFKQQLFDNRCSAVITELLTLSGQVAYSDFIRAFCCCWKTATLWVMKPK